MRKVFHSAKIIHATFCFVVFCVCVCEGVGSQQRIFALVTMNWKATSPTPSSHLCPIWIPHHGFLSVFTVIFDKTQLNDASLANDTWKNHLSVHYCFFRFFIRLTPPAPISVLFFPFIIKLGITPLPSLFSTQQLHTDVETLSFIVFGGNPSGLRCEREHFIRRLSHGGPVVPSFLLQLRCWSLTGTYVLSFKSSVKPCLIPSGWVVIVLTDRKVEKCQIVSADFWKKKKNCLLFFARLWLYLD